MLLFTFYFPLFLVDQHDVPYINNKSRCLAKNKNRISAMYCVRQQNRSARQREIPEKHGDVAFFSSFRCDPLNHETHSENDLTGEAKSNPQIFRSDFH